MEPNNQKDQEDNQEIQEAKSDSLPPQDDKTPEQGNSQNNLSGDQTPAETVEVKEPQEEKEDKASDNPEPIISSLQEGLDKSEAMPPSTGSTPHNYQKSKNTSENELDEFLRAEKSIIKKSLPELPEHPQEEAKGNELLTTTETEQPAADEENKQEPQETIPTTEISKEKDAKPKKTSKKPAAPAKPKYDRFATIDDRIAEGVVPQKDFDEVPVGGGGGGTQLAEYPEGMEPFPSGEAEAPQDAGPLATRVRSKVWKIRQTAFEELAQKFQEADVSDPIFEEYRSDLEKFIADSNPGAQEKALDALKTYLQKKNGASLDTNNLVKTLIDKALGPAKPNTKALSNEILCLIYENMDKPAIFEGIIDSINQKNQKTSCAGVQAVVELLKNYGPRRLDFLKPFFPHIEKLAASTVSSLRGEAMNFYKEAYRFMGEGVKPFLSKLKKIQVDELEKYFAEAPKEIAEPLREEEMRKKEGDGKGKDQGKGGKGAAEGFDPYEIADPVDIFKKYNDKWSSKLLALEKWNEKKNALEEFLKEIESTPKIASVPIQHITSMLKKLLNDNNFPIVSATVKVYGALAKGLRKGFYSPAKLIMPFLLEKLKDKRAALIEETTKTLDNFLYCLNLDDVFEDLKEGLANKSPNMRIALLSWIDRYFERNSKTPEKLTNLFKNLLPIIKKLVDDSANDVREASIKTLAKQKIILGEGVIGTSYDDLNPSRLSKINSIVSGATGIPIIESGDTSKIDITSPRANTKAKQAPEEEEKSPKPGSAKLPKSDQKPGVGRVAPGSGKKPEEAKKASGKDSAKIQPAKTIEIEQIEMDVPTDELEAKMKEMGLPENVAKGLNDANWKEKQKALVEFNQWVENNAEAVSGSLESVLQYLKAKLKDWKESNPNVLKETCQVLSNIASNQQITLTRKSFSLILPFVLMNIHEAKYTQLCHSIISSFIGAVYPKYVILALISTVQDKSLKLNPKAMVETCNILTKLIDELTLALFPLKETIEFGKTLLANSTSKTAAIGLFKAMYQQFGPPLSDFLTDINATSLKSLQTDFGKLQLKREATCKIQFRGEAEKDTKVDLTGPFDPLAAFPRADISKDAEKIIKKLNDLDWKVKQEGLEALDAVIASNGNRIAPNGLHNLTMTLKHRLNDNNKNQVKNFIIFVGKLAYALGPEGKSCAKDLVPEVVNNLSDKQAPIRSEAVKALDKFSDAIGSEMIINSMLPGLNNESPESRGEILNWILRHSDALAKADVKGNIKSILAVLQDKSKEIRNQAEKVFEKCVGIITIEPYITALKDMKPAIRDALRPVMKKYGDNEEPSIDSVDMSFEKSKTNPANQSRSLKKTSSEANLRNSQQLKSATTKLPHHGGNTTKAQAEEPKEFKKVLLNRSMQNINNLSSSGLNDSLSSNTELPAQPRVITSTGEKTRRQEEDRKTKWPTEELRDDLIVKLKDHLKKNVSKDLFTKMFATDPKKHVEAVKILSKALIVEFQDTLEILDLVLRWFFSKLWDNVNTQMMKESLDYFFSLTMSLEAAKYTMLDFEANVLIPCLVNRLGTGPSNLKISLHKIFPKLGGICPPQKVAGFLVDALRSRSHKTKVESIEVLAEMVKVYGPDIISQKDIKTYGKLLSDHDVNIKANALKLMSEVGQYLGEGLLSLTGTDIPPKLQEIVQQKIISPPASFRDNEVEIEGLNRSKVELASEFEQIKEEVEEEQALAASQWKPRRKVSDKLSGSVIERDLPEDQGRGTIEEAFEQKSEEISMYDQDQDQDQYQDQNQSQYQYQDQPMMEDEEEIKNELDLVMLRGDTVDEVLFEKCLKLLKEGSVAGKLDALMFVQDIINSEHEQNKEILEKKASPFLVVLQGVLNTILAKYNTETPYKFLMFFLDVLHKLSTLKTFLKGASQESLQALYETLFQKILILIEANKVEGQENSGVLKSINSIVLRLLEHCDPNLSLSSLYALASKYEKPDADHRIVGLLAKCILKLANSLDCFGNDVAPNKILLELHKYMITHGDTTMEADEDIMLQTVKITLRKLVRLYGEKIHEHYKASIEPYPISDEYIKDWIEIMLRSQNDKSWTPQNSLEVGNSPMAKGPNSATNQEVLGDIKNRIDNLTKTTNFEDGIKEIYEVLQKHPGHLITPYLEGKKESFKLYVMTALERLHYEKRTIDSEHLLGKGKNGCHIKPIDETKKEEQPNENEEKGIDMEEFQKRMNTLKIRFALLNKSSNMEISKIIKNAEIPKSEPLPEKLNKVENKEEEKAPEVDEVKVSNEDETPKETEELPKTEKKEEEKQEEPIKEEHETHESKNDTAVNEAVAEEKEVVEEQTEVKEQEEKPEEKLEDQVVKEEENENKQEEIQTNEPTAEKENEQEEVNKVEESQKAEESEENKTAEEGQKVDDKENIVEQGENVQAEETPVEEASSAVSDKKEDNEVKTEVEQHEVQISENKEDSPEKESNEENVKEEVETNKEDAPEEEENASNVEANAEVVSTENLEKTEKVESSENPENAS